MTPTRAPAPQGFLAQVIERGYERVPLIAPRRASWFEPLDERAPAADAIDDAAAPHPLRASVPPAPAATIEPRNTMPMRAEDAAPRDAPVNAARASAVVVAEVRSPAVADAMPLSPRAAAVPPPLVPLQPAAASAREVAATLPATAVARAAQTAPVLQPAMTPRRVEAPTMLAPRDPREAPNASAQPERALLQSFAASLPLARGEAAAPAASPQVTISIGRVEVRAAASTAAPVRTTTPARPAALADYLGRKERAR